MYYTPRRYVDTLDTVFDLFPTFTIVSINTIKFSILYKLSLSYEWLTRAGKCQTYDNRILMPTIILSQCAILLQMFIIWVSGLVEIYLEKRACVGNHVCCYTCDSRIILL